MFLSRYYILFFNRVVTFTNEEHFRSLSRLFIGLKPRTHEQIKYPVFEQLLIPYEVNLSAFAQINGFLFAHAYRVQFLASSWLSALLSNIV